MSLLCCAATACGTETNDPQGTYHLTLTRQAPEASAPRVPSTVSWPDSAELTLRFDQDGHAKVSLLGFAATVSGQQIVTDDQRGYTRPIEEGTLLLQLDAAYDILSVDDPVACPQTGAVDFGSYFELLLLDGHATGWTAGSVVCNRAGIPFEGFTFDVTGDRVSD